MADLSKKNVHSNESAVNTRTFVRKNNILTETWLNQDIGSAKFLFELYGFSISTWIGMSCMEKAGMEGFPFH